MNLTEERLWHVFGIDPVTSIDGAIRFTQCLPQPKTYTLSPASDRDADTLRQAMRHAKPIRIEGTLYFAFREHRGRFEIQEAVFAEPPDDNKG